jgi:hypothetical protein
MCTSLGILCPYSPITDIELLSALACRFVDASADPENITLDIDIFRSGHFLQGLMDYRSIGVVDGLNHQADVSAFLMHRVHHVMNLLATKQLIDWEDALFAPRSGIFHLFRW